MGTLLIVALIVSVAAIWLYNILVRDRNRVLAGWSDIDVQLKKRHDLVPQLVSAVKAYSAHEKATLIAVTELRTQSEASTELAAKAALEDQIEQAMHKLLIVAEDYPDLKADQNFRQLQSELVEIEDHLQYARRYYNGAVRLLNTHIQSFPHLLLARPLGFKSAEFFSVNSADEREAPRVELS